jgi:hypothetical protein
MAAITRIDVRLKTGARSGAGTDGDIYLGIGGREFSLDSAADDFEAGSDRVYVFGQGANVVSADANDPRQPYGLRTETLARFPVYLRFEPKTGDDNWNLESIGVTVNPGPGQLQFGAMGGSDHLWLGRRFGKTCYLLG